MSLPPCLSLSLIFVLFLAESKASAFPAAAKLGIVAMTSRCSAWVVAVVAVVAVRVAVTIGKARWVMVPMVTTAQARPHVQLQGLR